MRNCEGFLFVIWTDFHIRNSDRFPTFGLKPFLDPSNLMSARHSLRFHMERNTFWDPERISFKKPERSPYSESDSMRKPDRNPISESGQDFLYRIRTGYSFRNSNRVFRGNWTEFTSRYTDRMADKIAFPEYKCNSCFCVGFPF